MSTPWQIAIYFFSLATWTMLLGSDGKIAGGAAIGFVSAHAVQAVVRKWLPA